MRPYGFIALLVLTMCVGCITVSGKPVAKTEEKIQLVCIKRNPKVIVPEFTEILEEGFSKHGIATKFYEEVPSTCTHRLTYTARQKWDVVRFLSDAHLALYKGDILIGYADRSTSGGIFGGGGIDPAKWKSTRSKLEPMIDELLENIAPLPHN